MGHPELSTGMGDDIADEEIARRDPAVERVDDDLVEVVRVLVPFPVVTTATRAVPPLNGASQCSALPLLACS